MKQRILLIACISLMLTATPVFAVEPALMTPDEIVFIDRARDGTMVLLSGEAIGEDLHADSSHRWVNVLGDSLAVGVYMTNDEAARITTYGDHTHEGARVEVFGMLNIGCDQHGGEFDVHAEQVSVLIEGQPTERPIAPWKGVAAAAFFVVGLVEWRLLRHLRERRLA